MNVTTLTAQIIKRRQLKINLNRVAFDNRRQSGRVRLPNQRSNIRITFADITGERRTHHRITQLQFGLLEIGLTHRNIGTCHVQCRYRIVQIKLTRRILLVKRTQTQYVTFRFRSLGLVLLQLSLGLLNPSLVLIVIDVEQRLVHLNQFTLLESHLLQEALDTGVNLNPTHSLDQTYIISINLYVVDCHILDSHYRNINRCFLTPAQQDNPCKHSA